VCIPALGGGRNKDCGILSGRALKKDADPRVTYPGLFDSESPSACLQSLLQREPIEIRITEGQIGDVTQGDLALKGEPPEYVICDKGYDSTEFRAYIRTAGSKPVILCRKHRREQIEYDTHVKSEFSGEFLL